MEKKEQQSTELSYKINVLEAEGKLHEKEDIQREKKAEEVEKLKLLLSKHREQLLNSTPISKKLRKYASTISPNQKSSPAVSGR